MLLPTSMQVLGAAAPIVGVVAPKTCLLVVLALSYFGRQVCQFRSTENDSALNYTYSKGRKTIILAAPWNLYTKKNLNMK